MILISLWKIREKILELDTNEKTPIQGICLENVKKRRNRKKKRHKDLTAACPPEATWEITSNRKAGEF